MYFTEHSRSIFYVAVLNSPLFKRLVKYRYVEKGLFHTYIASPFICSLTYSFLKALSSSSDFKTASTDKLT